jgi:hypothetical protein
MQEEYSQEELENMLKEYTGLPEPDTSNKPKKIINKKLDVVQKVDDSDLITNKEIATEEDPNKIISIPIISLVNWIRRHGKSIPQEIKTVDFNIIGISNDEYLLVKVPKKRNSEKKELLMFKDANKIPVLDLDISEISMYNSGIRMIHPFNDGFIKCYTGRPNYLIASLSNKELLPYYITKVKVNNSLIFKENESNIDNVLKEIASKEELKLVYPVIIKDKNWSSMRTNGEFFKYFLDLQKNIKDNAHHVKIDNIMISMIKGKHLTDKDLATHVSYQLIHNTKNEYK